MSNTNPFDAPVTAARLQHGGYALSPVASIAGGQSALGMTTNPVVTATRVRDAKQAAPPRGPVH